MCRAALLLAPGAALLLSGCLVASAVDTAVDVATLPVKVASRGVDLATTSQAEADRNRGREIRRREERLGRLEREQARYASRCQSGNQAACSKAAELASEIQTLLPTVPVEQR
jgi:hypothetical protein